MIVHAGTHHAGAVAVRDSGDGKRALGEVDIEIFDLGAPVRRETNFGTEAGSPADGGMAFGETEGLAIELAKGETGGAIEQHVAEGVTAAARHPAETGIGEPPAPENTR